MPQDVEPDGTDVNIVDNNAPFMQLNRSMIITLDQLVDSKRSNDNNLGIT